MLMYKQTDYLEVLATPIPTSLAMLIHRNQHQDTFLCFSVELFLRGA